MARRFRRSVTRSRSVRQRGTKKLAWVTTLFTSDFELPTVPRVDVTVLDPGDFIQGASGSRQEHAATLMAIRGYVSVLNTDDGSVGLDAYRGYIAKIDQDQLSTVANMDPTLVATYNDESILWTMGNLNLQFSAGAQKVADRYEVNVRARRRLSSDDAVQMRIGGTVDPSGLYTVFGLLRALILLP